MDNQLITDLIISLFGVIFVVLGFSKRSQRSALLKDGIKTEGVVFRVEQSNSISIGVGNTDTQDISYYPVIRYVTKENEWITEKYDIGAGILNKYNEGDKVTVIYDPANNTKFILNDTTTKLAAPLAIIIGIVLIIVPLICYFLNIPLTH